MVMDMDPFHALPLDQVVESLGTDSDAGLDAAEAQRRLASGGPNQLRQRKGTTALSRLAHQFSDVLIWVLIVAAAVSGLLLGEWIEAGVILAIVVLNAALGFRQESKADEALAALEALAAPHATVVRNGKVDQIAAADLVPGDLVMLDAGALVPADLRVVSVVGMSVDESALTGESLPVTKGVEPVPGDSPVGDMRCMLHGGTVVVAGRGRGVVTMTGANSRMGAIAGMLEEEDPPTPLEAELKRVGWRLGALAVGVAAIIFGLGVAQGRPLEAIFLLAVALAVAAIPEGLPAIVTLTLARGVRKMADHNAIVRRLPAVEALGAATVICTDKTGTLTRNEIRVQETDVAGLRLDDLQARANDGRVAWYLRIAVLCNDAQRSGQGWSGDPTEVALIRSAEPFVDVGQVRQRHPRIDEVAFDSDRKRMSTLHQDGAGVLVAAKGAPETVVERCTHYETADGPAPIPPERARSALAAAEEMAGRGLRTLAFGYRHLDAPPVDPADAETDLVLVGLVGMRDELRPEAGQAVLEAQQAGIEVVMITGDHEITATTIGRELGLIDGREVMPGRQLAESTVDELAGTVDRYSVYARVDPADKVKIVRAWQARGAVVAMTGDGVNDAPALRIADIGVAMGSGTDVARQASDIVLADDNFATIVRAVREGRTIFTNLRNVVSFLLAANLSEVAVVFFGFLVWGGLGEPLLATQLLWVNLVTDGLPALALGVDPPGPDVMRQAPSHGSVLGWRRQIRLIVIGIILAIPVLGTFAVGVGADLEWTHVRTVAFTALVLTQLVYVYALRVGENGWRVGLSGNRALGWAVFGSMALHALVVMTPVGNVLFDTVPLGVGEWGLAVAAAAIGGLAVIVASHPLTRLGAR